MSPLASVIIRILFKLAKYNILCFDQYWYWSIWKNWPYWLILYHMTQLNRHTDTTSLCLIVPSPAQHCRTHPALSVTWWPLGSVIWGVFSLRGKLQSFLWESPKNNQKQGLEWSLNPLGSDLVWCPVSGCMGVVGEFLHFQGNETFHLSYFSWKM